MENGACEQEGSCNPREFGAEIQRFRDGWKRGIGHASFERREEKRKAYCDERAPKALGSLPLGGRGLRGEGRR